MKNILFLFLIIGFVWPVWSHTDSPKEQGTVIFLVRHAEKTNNSSDPELSSAGVERAVILAQTLASSDIDYVHSSDFIRTRNTAAPVAQLFGLKTEIYNPRDLPALSKKLLKNNARHLVVGHSNTTPQLVKLLDGDPGSEINEKSEYDRLYILTIQGEKVSTVLLRYGKKYKP